MRRGLTYPLDESYVTTSICGISRASLFSGQWMSRHGARAFKQWDTLNVAFFTPHAEDSHADQFLPPASNPNQSRDNCYPDKSKDDPFPPTFHSKTSDDVPTEGQRIARNRYFNGKKHERGSVEGASRFLIQTFASHTWLILDDTGQTLGHIIAAEKPARIILP